MVYVSVRGRILLNAEALNMTESVGNYVKRRRVPVMAPVQGGYGLFFVPAISGEAIAHAYQEILTEEAKKRKLPVCRLCEKGIFLKSANDDVVKYSFPGIKFPAKNEENFDLRFEENVIKNCTVEDIGGFLYAPAKKGGQGSLNVKRTSNFMTGYMIPVREALESVVIDPQLHTRYALGTNFVKTEREAGQMIYYVEVTSAAYTFSFDVDSKNVGRISFNAEKAGQLVVDKDKLRERMEAALDALAKLILEARFGAKRTRFLPNVEWESIAIAVSDGVWTLPSPFTADYIKRAESKKEKINYNTALYCYPDSKWGSIEEAVLEAIDDAKKRVEEELKQAR